MIKAVCEITERAITRRILVAEDNKTIQEMVFRFLKHMGLEVALADNGVEALAVFQKSCFDLVLSDFQMPVMDGYTATEKIRAQQRFKGLPIIAMTANVMDGDRQDCLAAGMDDYVGKPVRPGELEAALARCLASSDAGSSDDGNEREAPHAATAPS